VTASATHRAIDAVWRIESAKLIAGLARIVRDDLLAKLGRFDEAREEFARAASLTRNASERTLLLERAAACAAGSVPTKTA
jgi:predicted RNA polymerase sigma factor